ncbi:ComEA family DNA-binding protein [Corynebacterium lubricantis]|uniref:ComEA family DNA-binding protein n=1 Tax=Corynebacterium lubricantis TaxID=541095 RepID=UPI000382A40D|nr:ComEA family DNA-binding protein [Corynebacterium lubricantis]
MNGVNALDRIKELTRPTGEEDLLQVSYPAPRFTVSLKHALIVAAVLLVAVAVWFVARSSPATEEQVEQEHEWGQEWEAGAEPTDAPESVVVSVVGEVEHPGLVTLSQGARVADALEQAVPLPNADIVTLNQAQLLVDGQQLHVLPTGVAPAVEQGQVAAPGTGLISLNSADEAELMELDGVGETTAASIIAHREEIGSFTELEQLLDVSGIGPAKFAAIKDEVSL